MDAKLTIMETLYSIAAAQDGVDETNIIFAVRKAQKAVLAYTGQPGWSLFIARPQDEVDDILIMATQNGKVDIFA